MEKNIDTSKRFVTIYHQTETRVDEENEYGYWDLRADIIKDRETGVLYIRTFHGGITPLLGADSKVIIDNSDK